MPISWYQGNANIKLDNFEKAMINFKDAYDQHPYNHYVLNDLASAYYMKNQLDSAILFYKESARINPRFDDPKLNLTAIFINENNGKCLAVAKTTDCESTFFGDINHISRLIDKDCWNDEIACVNEHGLKCFSGLFSGVRLDISGERYFKTKLSFA